MDSRIEDVLQNAVQSMQQRNMIDTSFCIEMYNMNIKMNRWCDGCGEYFVVPLPICRWCLYAEPTFIK